MPGAIPTAPLRERLTTLAERLRARGARCSVFVDSNHHVDRDAAVRAGLAFSARNTMAIVPGEGSFVALGAIVTDAELEPAGGARAARLRLLHALHRRLPDRRPDRARRARRDALPLDDDAVAQPGARGARRRARATASTAATSARTSAPGTPGPRAAAPSCRRDPGAWVSLADWLELPDDELLARHAHLYVPDRDPRYLRRNALIALGNGPAGERELARRYADDPDPQIRAAARRALTA